MPAITVKVSEELAEQLRNHKERLGEILELGLRGWNAETQHGFEGAAEVLEFLAGLPSAEEILTLRPSLRLEKRVQELLEKSRAGELTAAQEEEWERYQYLEHLVRVAKTQACLKLGITPADA